MRAFVAVTPPETVRQALAEPWARLGRTGVRPVPVSHLHLTLVFLPDLAEEAAKALAAFLAAMPAEEGTLETAGLVRFPSEARPRVLAVEVRDPSGALARMRETVVAFLRGRRLVFDDRKPFRPHMTLLRFDEGHGVPREIGRIAPPPLAWTLGRPGLYRSELERGRPPRYERVLP